MAAHSPPRGSRRPFPRFPVSMGFTPCVIFDSQHNRACCYALLQGGSSIWMQSLVWQPVEPLLYCPLASAEPIYTGAGESASEGYRPDLLQDVPDQGHHMLTSRAHVPGLASGSDCKIWSILPLSRFPVKIPMTNIPKTLFQLTHIYVGGGMLFNHLKYSMVLQVEIHVATSLTEVCDVLLGTLGVSLDRFFPHWKTFSSNSNISGSSLTTTTYVPRRYTERMSFSRLFRCWLRDLGFLVLSFLETRMQEDRPFPTTGTFAWWFYCDTCQGRDHLVRVQSGRQSPVIVNVHFEPELSLRRLRERLRLITPHWPSYPNAVGIILGDFNICEPEEGRFKFWNQTFTDGAMFHSFFPHVLESAQPDYTWRDSTALGIIRTLSRIDRIFMNLPMAEAEDFHCYSHVFWESGKPDHSEWSRGGTSCRSRKPTNRGATGQTHSKLDVQASRFLFYSEAASRWPPTLCRSILRTCRVQNYSWKGQKADCSWALTEDTWQHGSKALNRLHCITCLQKKTSWDTRAMLWGMEARWKMLWPGFFWVCWLPEAQSDYCERCSWKSCWTWSRDNESPLDTDGERQCASQMQSWTPRLVCQKNQCFCLNAVTDEDGHPLENEDETGRRLCEYWEVHYSSTCGRPETSPRHRLHEEILRHVQQAPDDIRWTFDRTEFDELIALEKDSALGPDGIPYGACKCAGRLGFQFLFNAYKYLLEGGTVPEHFAESRTVFIFKTSDIDDNGRIFRSPDALRPLTLCNCDCKLLTSAICRGLHWYTMRCIHPSQRCISSRHMTDNETTALAHVACAPQESGILLTDFAATYPSVNHSWILSVIEKTELPEFICRFVRSIL